MALAEPFEGSTLGRFQVLSRLGEGGMGVVYEVVDRERNLHLALKAIRDRGLIEPAQLVRFKQEFRSLKNVLHTNLVSLGELFDENGALFFTMELVHGADFIRYVRPGEAPLDRAELETTRPTSLCRSGVKSATPESTAVAFDETRLRASLLQVARGLVALHAAGKVHRDIKPQNILIDETGRAVILDFGIAADAGVDDDVSAGTPSFMAPEQCAGSVIGASADWYSVGVLLYLALTGRLPFSGAADVVLALKRENDPLPPSRLCPAAPADLDALCVELLARDPALRPTGREILERLRASASELDLRTSLQANRSVGRERELATLMAVFDETKRAQPATVLVSGEWGVGKTSLVKEFAARLQQQHPDAIVLFGRCDPNESVPFNAFDMLIDALSSRLKKLPLDRDFFPEDIGLVALVFPVLRQVAVIDHAAETARPPISTHEQRLRVFTAFRQLLDKMASLGPLVVELDDLHWADADSVALLTDLIRPPDAPSMMLVATARTAEAAEQSTPLSKLVERLERIELQGLPAEAAREFARNLVEAAGYEASEAATALADDIAREAHGHPILIEEMLHHAMISGDAGRAELRVETAIWGRITRLDPRAHAVLDLLAVAGAPIAEPVLHAAAELEAGELDRLLRTLRGARIVRSSERNQDHVDVCHERVRTTLLGHMAASRQRLCHERLARAYETAGVTDADALMTHFREAGDVDRAVHFAVTAATQAERALAFDRAARYYRSAIDLRPGDPGVPILLRHLGEALSNAGRGVEAAAAFLDAAARATGDEAIALRRTAAHQYLRAGHIDEGTTLLKSVLRALGVSTPDSPPRVILSLISGRAKLRLRGTSFSRRDARDISIKDLTRIDACLAASQCLGLVDMIRAGDLQTRGLLLALKVGEPHRAAHAIGLEAAHIAPLEPRTGRAERLLDVALALVDQFDDDPYTTAMVRGYAGAIACAQARWRDTCAPILNAEPVLRGRCVGWDWEMFAGYLYVFTALGEMGELGQLARHARNIEHEARSKQHIFGLATTLLRTNLPILAGDDPAHAEARIDEALARWSVERYHVQHVMATIERTQIDLYRAQPGAAWTRLQQQWGPLRRSMLLRSHNIRVSAHFWRACTALAVAASGHDVEAMLQAADRDIGVLDDKSNWTGGRALLLRASLAALRREPERALGFLDAAIPALEQDGLSLHALAARTRKAALVGGDEGARLLRSAEDGFRQRGVTVPERFVSLFSPWTTG